MCAYMHSLINLSVESWTSKSCIFSSYMGTITGISDLDPARWPNSHWRSVKVSLCFLLKMNFK